MSQLHKTTSEGPLQIAESLEQNRNDFSKDVQNRKTEDYIQPRFRVGKIGFLTLSRNWSIGAIVLPLFLFGLVAVILFSGLGHSSNGNGDKQPTTNTEQLESELEEYKTQSHHLNAMLTGLKKYFKRKNWSAELFLAIHGKEEDVLKELIAFGADVHAVSYGEATLLHRAATCNDTEAGLRMIKFLIENGAGPFSNSRSRDGFTFLHKLVDDGTTLTPSQFHDISSFLVSKNLTAIFNVQGTFLRGMKTPRYSFQYRGSTPLQMEVKNLEVKPETLALLYQNGVNFNLTNCNGESILKYAVEGKRNTTLLSDLIGLGADWKHVNNLKGNLLHMSALYNNLESMKYFVKLGLDVNSINTHGNTPLHYAALYGREGSLEIIRFLVENGADLSLKNDNFPPETALDRAVVRYDNTDKGEILQLLRNSR